MLSVHRVSSVSCRGLIREIALWSKRDADGFECRNGRCDFIGGGLMSIEHTLVCPAGGREDTTRLAPAPEWHERYGKRHGYFRVMDDPSLPNGRRGRVTIYQRGKPPAPSGPKTFILYWCWGGKRRKEKVIGDKYDAVRRADEINAAIQAGPAPKDNKVGVEALVQGYLDYLRRRAEAGEVAPGTVTRYQAALAYLLNFVRKENPALLTSEWVPDRDSMLRFRGGLQGKMIRSKSRPGAVLKPLTRKGIDFIVASARAMVRWAVQEELLPKTSADAFAGAWRRPVSGPPVSWSPISTEEVVQIVQAADLYQLVLLSFHLFHGVRVAEPCWLMLEFYDRAGGWLDYRCIEELGYRTKGGVDKRLPVPEFMASGIDCLIPGRSGGLLLLRRRHLDRSSAENIDLKHVIHTVRQSASAGWCGRVRAARACLREAGALEGDDVRREFRQVLRAAGIQTEVTPKALRHYFATALERADVPYYTRKYLLGHRLSGRGGRGSDITAVYTHLEPDLIRSAYQRVLDGPLAKVANAFTVRLADVGAVMSLGVRKDE